MNSTKYKNNEKKICEFSKTIHLVKLTSDGTETIFTMHCRLVGHEYLLLIAIVSIDRISCL